MMRYDHHRRGYSDTHDSGDTIIILVTTTIIDNINDDINNISSSISRCMRACPGCSGYTGTRGG